METQVTAKVDEAERQFIDEGVVCPADKEGLEKCRRERHGGNCKRVCPPVKVDGKEADSIYIIIRTAKGRWF